MPASPRAQQNYRTHRKMVSEGKLIPFENAAAGHEGVQSTATGELIFKPCTQSEVDFYESTAAHPDFVRHIPVHVGALTLRSHAPDLSALAAGQSQASGASVAATSIPEETPIITAALTPEMSRNIMPLMAPPPAQGWTPSGGKRIDSGLLIALENVAYGFQRPNILDVKLGARLWADDAPPAKRAKLDTVAKETTSGSLGFRIAGMKVWKHPGMQQGVEIFGEGHVVDKDGYRCYNKNYGRAFRDHNVHEAFESYFYGLAGMRRSKSNAIIRRMLVDLHDIEATLKAEESRMYSSSILMVYEGDPAALDLALEEEEARFSRQADLSNGVLIEEPTAIDGLGDLTDKKQVHSTDNGDAALDDEDSEDEELGPKVYDVRLIDFAHAEWTPGQGPDENILHGIHSVIQILEKLVDQ